MKIICWVFVLWACVVATSVTENSETLTDDDEQKILAVKYNKKMTSRIVTKNSFREIAAEAGDAIMHALHGIGKNLNEHVIEKTINSNYKEHHIFKYLLARNPSWEKHIFFQTRNGWWWVCGESFCRSCDNGLYGFGLCSPYICFCNFGQEQKYRCLEGLVYDPAYRDCDIPQNVTGCS